MNILLITRETDYALRILRALSGGERMTAAEICRKELLPQQFAYKILKKLERAGCIQISRGADGGCRLTADLNQTSLYDLTEIIGEDRSVSACMGSWFQCSWRQNSTAGCQVHRQLLQIQRVLDAELKSRSLHQMLFGVPKKSAESPEEPSIS